MVAATLAALTVRVKSLHVLGATQIGAPTTPVVFSTSVSVYVISGLVGLSVPLDGFGAATPTKLKIASETAEMENRIAKTARVCVKPDLSDDFFFTER